MIFDAELVLDEVSYSRTSPKRGLITQFLRTLVTAVL